MAFSMTAGAECNQILRHIPAKSASRRNVMNLQVLRGAAVLASPTISFQHVFSDHGVFFQLQFESRLPLA
jgi:hypothetical protein